MSSSTQLALFEIAPLAQPPRVSTAKARPRKPRAEPPAATRDEPPETPTVPENLSDTADPLYSRKQAARYLSGLGLQMAPQTLARKFHEGIGPLCTHAGERAMYRKSHLDEYFASQLSAPRRSSSERRKPAR